jgi:hypothetical protein
MDEGRMTAANVAVHVLDRMLKLGRPIYVVSPDLKAD